MTRIRKPIRRALCTLISLVTAGCGPSTFEQAVSFHADQHRVRDAAARRVSGYWHLRFNEMLLSDLDEAIARPQNGSESEAQAAAVAVLGDAHNLGAKVSAGEIARLPDSARAALAELASCAGTTTALNDHYSVRADAALRALTDHLQELSERQLLDELRRLRSNVEPAIDDQGRLARQLAYHWAAIPVLIGVDVEEKKAVDKAQAKIAKAFDAVTLWRSGSSDDDRLLDRFAPTIAVEWPDTRGYPNEYDLIGSVQLTGSRTKPTVDIDPSRPAVYAYTAEAKIENRRYNQLVYVWWFPERPEMEDKDPVAGHVDGNTLRITLDACNRPAIFEVMQNCGCGHQIFVADHIETAARKEFGDPLSGKTLSIEKGVEGRRDLIVAGTVNVGSDAGHPVVYIDAGYHEVCRIEPFDVSLCTVPIVDSRVYKLHDYGVLDRLALDDGVFSMFGADGLVHDAGRSEGYWLAPTGILSAGQPRKRGTQRIRWDEYTFDDPRLLEKTLRFPAGF